MFDSNLRMKVIKFQSHVFLNFRYILTEAEDNTQDQLKPHYNKIHTSTELPVYLQPSTQV